MQTTSDLFRRRIRQSGQRRTVADLYLSGMPVIMDLPVSSGSITADRNSAVRRSGSIVIQDRRLVKDILSGLLLPFGYEIRVRQGIVYPDRAEELVPLGVFMAYDVSWEESTGQIPTIQLFDRSKMMEDNQSTHTFEFAGHTFVAAMQEILRWHYPGLTIEFGPEIDTGLLIPGGTLYDTGSLLEIVQQMAAAIGGEFYFDAHGVPQVQVAKKLEDYTSDDSVWDVDVGENGILRGANRSISRAGVYNKVTVHGNAGTNDTIQPVYQVGNIDPLSPARRFGPFGVVDLRIEDNTLKELYQCQMLAVDKLAEVSRLATSMDFTCVVSNPALEEGDIVTAKYADETTQLALLESVTFPIETANQAGKCSVGRIG